MSKMNEGLQQKSDKIQKHNTLQTSESTSQPVEVISQFLQSCVGSIIGMILTMLLTIVTVVSVTTILINEKPESTQILVSIIAAIGTVLAAIVGHLLARKRKSLVMIVQF